MTDKGLVARAEAFARIHHKGQFRKGEAAEPYIFHVAEVAFSVKDLGGDEIAQSGAWLHDVVEDCTPSLADIEQEFGSEVANVVSEVTDDKTLKKLEYEAELRELQSELVNLQQWIAKKQMRVAVLFEGRDASGKGGVVSSALKNT